MSLTTTITVDSHRHRLRSLSLIAAHSPILSLPSELLLDIFETILVSESKPGVLASVSKSFATFIETIIYRTIILNSEESIRLLHRTLHSKPYEFFGTHVKRLGITWSPIPNSTPCRQIWDIVVASSGIVSLSLPAGYHTSTIASLVRSPVWHNLSELVLQSFDDMDALGRCTSLHYPPTTYSLLYDPAPRITHLRILEPGATWHSPASIMETLGQLPSLTHIQLPRRAGANAENDMLFVADVEDMLAARDSLKMALIYVVPPSYRRDDVKGSAIWKMLESVSSKDKRLQLTEEEFSEWTDAVHCI